MEKEPDKEWDAGDIGCGQLVLELSRRLRVLEAGQVLRLIARDPGAPEDLPAWCRLTGHTLLKSGHPEYWIQKKKKG
jgi:tRNA 2-thiouridine synthesizing protein A